jgi:hypothetical protein
MMTSGDVLQIQFSNSQDSRNSSLRANGSRECAPDDRLREAIDSAEGWIASSQVLLAMTLRQKSAISRRDASELYEKFPPS